MHGVQHTEHTMYTTRLSVQFFWKIGANKKNVRNFFSKFKLRFFHQSLSKGSTSPHSNLIERSMACKMCKICMVSTVCMIRCAARCARCTPCVGIRMDRCQMMLSAGKEKKRKTTGLLLPINNISPRNAPRVPGY